MNSPSISLEETVQLGAADGVFYSQRWFPRTCRLPSPPFHREIWDVMSCEATRYVNLLVFRDGGKTSTLRLFSSRRVAYNQSHNILWLGKSEPHAVRSLDWLRRQVEFNKPWASAFGLRKGKKWLGTEAEIVQKVPGADMERRSFWLLAAGIEGSVRGININDYRPDLIIVDDVIDENSASKMEREKICDLVMGAVFYSLAPATEAPFATMVMLSTPQHPDDAAMVAARSSLFYTVRYSCWTPETEDLDVSRQESRWEARLPSEQLRREKVASLTELNASRWYREKECKLISPETCAFRPQWLRFWDVLPSRSQMTVVVSIDPVPRPTVRQVETGLKDKDYEVIAVVGRGPGGEIFLLEYSENRGHDPSWTAAEFMRLAYKWRPRSVEVESTAYQSTLVWLLERAMREAGRYYVVNEVSDRRGKYVRIVDTLRGLASHGRLLVGRGHTTFLQQFRDYPNTKFDDVLDCTAMGVMGLMKELYDTEEVEEDEKEGAALRGRMLCP